MSNFKNIFLLIVSPREGWKDAEKYNVPHGILLRDMYLPLLLVLFATSYLELLFTPHETTPLSCTQHGIVSVVKYIFGVYISAYFISCFFPFVRKTKTYYNKFNNFLIYNLSVLIILEILSNLFLDLPFFIIFRLYIVYVIYKGLDYIDVEKDIQAKFVIYTGVILLLVPFAAELIVGLCVPNYKIF